MSKTVQKVVSCRHEKVVAEEKLAAKEGREPDYSALSGFIFQGGPSDAPGDEHEITVVIDIEVPDGPAEAAGENFYQNETAVNDVLEDDWSRRCMNTSRGPMRTTEQAQDWQTFAQTLANGYRPGRRGGFGPRVSADEAREAGFDMTPELEAFLRAKGAIK